MPRFGIPFLVIAILAGSIAINSVQFPVVREMLSPGGRTGFGFHAGGSPQGGADSTSDFEIPEPIARLDSPRISTRNSPPKSPTSSAMVAQPYRTIPDPISGPPIVAEVARPIASDRTNFVERPVGNKGTVFVGDDSTEEDGFPMPCPGSWDRPSTNSQPHGEDSLSSDGGDPGGNPWRERDRPPPYGSSLPGDAASLPGDDRTGASSIGERGNVYIPPPPKQDATRQAIDWPAETAPSGRYARRSTTSAIAHADPVPAAEERAVASTELVPIRRPAQAVATTRSEPVSDSNAAANLTEETANLPKIERLPAVK